MNEPNNDRDCNDSVKVAVRIRPLVESEIARGCNNVLEVIPSLQQVQVADKAFTYNYVYDCESTQEEFYNSCSKKLITNLFKGYNVTILAYGQTGSGKTYTMGTCYDGEGEMGIIPRAIHDIFTYVRDNFSYDFTVTVTFMELYQETLYDLLSKKPKDQCNVEIRDDGKNILIPNLTEETVDSAHKALEFLRIGSLSRVVGSTNMNAQSSRSHAIFTINLCMQKKDDSNQNKAAKFHLVDLAGSERSKKTGATGQTFKEGININKGLLALGNVISALGDEKLQAGYISYRDSNLTRLLKDSLGGNSITLMIACVSPADYNLEETLSTLRYADRARKIKNKPIVNQDPKIAEINRLKKTIQQLRLELIGQGGPIVCQGEIDTIRKENDQMKAKIHELTVQLSSSINEKTGLLERLIILQTSNERLREKLLEIKKEYDTTLNSLNLSIQQNDGDMIRENMRKLEIMKLQLTELDTEHKKTEEEVRMHEADVAQIQNQMFTNNKALVNDIEMEKELKERHEYYAAHQMAKDLQLQELSKMLAMKERLAQQIASNNCYMVDYQAITETEEKINSLEKEKEDLLVQLKKAQTTGNEPSAKGAEIRRRRIQELEKEIQDLRRKVTEQARLIKMKEKDELKIKQLQNEIQSMKQLKVKLIRDMKQEADKFRQWKKQREQEVCKLREQDRKRQNQMRVMETMHSRQQNVLKRKVEEVAAINKRLKDALALRNAVQEQKNSGKVEQTAAWLRQEFNLFVSIIEAKVTLTGLLEDRAALHQQMENLKADASDEDSEEVKQLKNEIELRSIQIQDLQQKLLDSDEDNKSRARFDNIQTMNEAKYCLKMLFQLTSEIKKNEVNLEYRMSELVQSQNEMANKLKVLEANLIKNNQNHQLEMANVQKEYEEKVSVLLRQLRGVQVSDTEKEMNYRFNIQQQRIEMLEKQLEEKQKEGETVIVENSKLARTIDDITTVLFNFKEYGHAIRENCPLTNMDEYNARGMYSIYIGFKMKRFH
ncbi:chromosome-associated kinesin KIF4A isoform X2 [Agrilus planipennis]|uniref:Chromosome-associated kinesin KIF4A isoform X2 n=1 Tax=Agrilus planipennis TaxID=224129 RepID=A0A1W4XPH6_AGRPL|nr:chromosome-associated kinesin KIF4A isoform X2 [Agrilus planipennis]